MRDFFIGRFSLGKFAGVLMLMLAASGYSSLYAQTFDFSDAASAKRIKADISVLASDSLMGRETGTPGEWMARKYIESKFREMGIQPLFDTSYFQSFEFRSKSIVDMGTSLEINSKPLKLYIDYYPVGFSGNQKAKGDMVFCGNGIFCESKGINDYANRGSVDGKIVLLDLAVPEKLMKDNEVFDSAQKIVRVKRAEKMGAIGVIFFLSNKTYGEPLKNPDYSKDEVSIPVIFVQNQQLIDVKNPGKAAIAVNINRSTVRIGHNVGAFINNNAPTTVVIGGHYDHVGMGFFAARDKNNNEVHNGADDNASGAAGVLELARRLKGSDLKNNNYIFITFSGEEFGLYGSKNFLKSGIYPLDKINYLLNLDMIGRLRNNKVKIYSMNSSDIWKEIVAISNHFGLKVKSAKSLLGGSDHMSFTVRGIPAIFLHTGTEHEYHKATDDVELINPEGESTVLKLAYEIIKNLNDKGKIKFLKADMMDTLMGK